MQSWFYLNCAKGYYVQARTSDHVETPKLADLKRVEITGTLNTPKGLILTIREQLVDDFENLQVFWKAFVEAYTEKQIAPNTVWSLEFKKFEELTQNLLWKTGKLFLEIPWVADVLPKQKKAGKKVTPLVANTKTNDSSKAKPKINQSDLIKASLHAQQSAKTAADAQKASQLALEATMEKLVKKSQGVTLEEIRKLIKVDFAKTEELVRMKEEESLKNLQEENVKIMQKEQDSLAWTKIVRKLRLLGRMWRMI